MYMKRFTKTSKFVHVLVPKNDFIEIAGLVVCSLGNVRRCGFSQSSADGLWGVGREGV